MIILYVSIGFLNNLCSSAVVFIIVITRGQKILSSPKGAEYYNRWEDHLATHLEY